MSIRPRFKFMHFVLALGLVLGLALGGVSPASAALRCYVKANAVGLNNGSSWANGYTSLQSALANPACTEIWVAKGTYKPTSNTDRAISFVLKTGVALYGGFAGAETLLGQRNPAANPTILSGEIGAVGKSDNSYHVVDGTGTNSTARLDGFTITSGNADGAGGWPSPVGGGILNNPGSPSLANLTVSGNSSADNGAGMFNWASSPSLVNVTFTGNSAAAGGGGMENDDGSNPSLTNVTFSGNSAINGSAMQNLSSSPNMINVTISGNSALSPGGAIYNSNSNPTITNGILYGDAGAEIVNSSSTPIVTFSIVQGGYPGTGNLNANPLLKPLGNYGGFTQTMPLSPGSPAIDHGTNTVCPAADQRGVPRPQDGDGNTTKVCDMGATESRMLARAFPSVGSHDGWVLESTRTSSQGGQVESAGETFSVGDFSDRQIRSLLSFNTAVLPDNALLTSATLKIKKQGLVGIVDPFSDHGNLLVDVRKGAFSNNAALQLTDFQAAASKNAALTILNNPAAGGWYSRPMPRANLVYINKLGLTQFRLRFALQDNGDGKSNYLRFYSGNATTPSVRPLLIVKYYLP